MPNYKEKIAEFENNFSTVIDKSVRDLSMAFDNLYLDKNAKEIPPTIKLAEALLSGEHNISTKMQIHYDIANAYHDLRMIEGVYSERYLEKELYHLRCALDMYETNYYDADSDSAEVKVAQYIAMRSYTNLGNAYRALGRHIVAIDCLRWQVSIYRFCCLGVHRCKSNVMSRATIIMPAITIISKQNVAR